VFFVSVAILSLNAAYATIGDAPVELALGAEGGEVGAQVRVGEAPKVPLAAEAGPLGEDRQGEDLRVGEQGRTTGAISRGPTAAFGLPPVVHEYVQ
jgi:hypothetical protein